MTTTPCSPGAPLWEQGAARTTSQLAVRTAHRLPSAHDTATTGALHRRPHLGRLRHARSRGAPPAPLHRRPDRHRQEHAAAQSHRAKTSRPAKASRCSIRTAISPKPCSTHVPRARTNDLVYINPADIERPIGFNPLSRVPRRPQAHRRRWRRVRLPPRLAGELGAAARLHPHQRRARACSTCPAQRC